MADTSRAQVSITIGRSGQLINALQEVNRAGPVAEDGSFSNSQPSVGNKRSVRDRLGSNVDPMAHFDNKRLRGDHSRMSTSSSNDVDDMFLTKDDLRFKIMRKNILKKNQSNSQQNALDLREILSRRARSSTTSLCTQQLMPQPEHSRKHFVQPRDGRQHMREPRNSRQLMSEPRDVRQKLSEHRDYRLRLPELGDGRRVLPELKDVRCLRLGSNGSSLPGKLLSSRNSDALPKMELLSSHSPWTLDSLRQRPSERITGTSRGVSPPRRNEEQERRPLVRAYDDSRVVPYTSEEIFEHSRPMSATHVARAAQTAGPANTIATLSSRPMSASHVARAAQTAGLANTIATLPAPLPPSVPVAQKSSFTLDDQPTVDSFLHSLGLDKYSIHFKAEEVDMHALKQMGDNDLKELGVPMGPRKKIMRALLPRARRPV